MGFYIIRVIAIIFVVIAVIVKENKRFKSVFLTINHCL